MTTVLKFESNLLDAVTAFVMAPITAAYCLVWLIWQGCTLLWPYRRYIALATVAAAFVALCVAFPLLPLGMAIVGAFGWATYPRSVVRA